MKKELNSDSLNQVMNKILTKISDSQHEVFEIAETAKQEYEATKQDLQEIRGETTKTIQKVDKLRVKSQKTRKKLIEVSQNFNNYNEKTIKEVYEKAKEVQVELSLLQEKEKRLRNKRDELERRLQKLEQTVHRAENLISQIGIIKDYLANDLKEFSSQVEELKQKEELGVRIIEAQEAERKRVAREIHDGPAQLLANIVFKLEYSENLLEDDLKKAKEELNELKDLVKKSLKDVRKIIFDLRPMLLDDLGLVPALKEYINNFVDKTGLYVEFAVVANEVDLKSSYEVAVYRIVQESLNNAYQHAQAEQVDVKLEIKSDVINVVISDDGCGFKVTEVLNTVDDDSFGLLSMKERAELLQGRVDFTSQPGQGTKVKLRIPI
ncbi:sensor histidine kinase [Sporohalobacter salinus]|uniref:sensor histidine kinase n=1 Tax=Sporohalobacter salinus TaxID=1494606 RepID=UPI0019604EB0|nr:sensor histidine kinase [Sporohalobacter salinus]MBM7623011.1 two-component system sensor histidine kinase DegS [Sporohalobacter salinus]